MFSNYDNFKKEIKRVFEVTNEQATAKRKFKEHSDKID